MESYAEKSFREIVRVPFIDPEFLTDEQRLSLAIYHNLKPPEIPPEERVTILNRYTDPPAYRVSVLHRSIFVDPDSLCTSDLSIALPSDDSRLSTYIPCPSCSDIEGKPVEVAVNLSLIRLYACLP